MYGLKTKQDRLNNLDHQFKSLEDKKYTRDQYKDLNIFIQDDSEKKRYYLKVFCGSSTNPICNYYYSQIDRREAKIKDLKDTADLREKRKEDKKGQKRKLTGAAACARVIKNELKNEFPGVVFSVKSSNFSMGNSVNISWSDGPTLKEVDKYTGKYQEGHFDGMQDMYVYSNNGLDVGAKYVSCSRNMSENIKNDLLEYFKKHHAGCKDANFDDYIEQARSYLSQMIYRKFTETSYYKKPEDKKPDPDPQPKKENEDQCEYIDFKKELLIDSDDNKKQQKIDAWENKKLEKAEKYKKLAEKNREKSNEAYKTAKQTAGFIPMGQPVLVGHHSEGRHRRDLQRIDNNMRKSVEADKKAEYYEQKAENLENSNVISSDDPQAIEKLKIKLKSLQDSQETMKAANKIIKNKLLLDVAKVEKLEELGFTEKTAIELIEGDCMGCIGFAPYALSNNNQNIASVKKRIQYLSKLQDQETKEIIVGGVRVLDNTDQNRLQIFFEDIPAAETRKQLKSNGFRWSPKNKAWQSYRGVHQIDRAKRILENNNQ